MGIMADSKGKTANQLTRIVEQEKNKEHMLPPKITDSTPGEVHQKNLIADPAEDKYLGFGDMCGV